MSDEELMSKAHALVERWHVSKAAYFGEMGDTSLTAAVAAALRDTAAEARRDALREVKAAWDVMIEDDSIEAWNAMDAIFYPTGTPPIRQQPPPSPRADVGAGERGHVGVLRIETVGGEVTEWSLARRAGGPPSATKPAATPPPAQPDVPVKCDYGDACPGHSNPHDRPCGYEAPAQPDVAVGEAPGSLWTTPAPPPGTISPIAVDLSVTATDIRAAVARVQDRVAAFRGKPAAPPSPPGEPPGDAVVVATPAEKP